MKNKFGFLIFFPLLLLSVSCGSHSAGLEDEVISGPENTGTSSSVRDFAKSLSIGWNLGNTLDAQSAGNKNNLGLGTETSWGMPQTTEDMIRAVADEGFKTIRIPVSWHNHLVDADFTIDRAWLARVKTIVDWARNAGMKVIINIHHDNLTETQMSTTYGFCISADSSSPLKEKSKNYIKAIWRQVATEFKDYDENLIFEVLNEPRCIGSSYEWNTGSFTNEVKAANSVIMEYEKAALDVIRSTGGKNAERYIMIPPYAASPNMTDGWTLPRDSAVDKMIVSVHAYTPYEFCMGADNVFNDSHRGAIDWLFSRLNETYCGKDIPVVIGEASASDKGNTSERIKWASYYFKKAKTAGIPVIVWDNKVLSTLSGGTGTVRAECHGYFNRDGLSWYFPGIIAEMMKFK